MNNYKVLEISDLTILVSRGDESAYREIYERYKGSIYSTILHLAEDEFVAEEVLQETFIRLWNYRAKLIAVEKFDHWIYTVARNVFLSKLKKQVPKTESLDLIMHDIYQSETDYSSTEFKELERAFKEAIEHLSPKQKLTYQLIKIEGLSRKEVAKLLDVSSETVKWNLDEAVKKVRIHMIQLLKELPLVIIFCYLQKK